MMEQELDLAGKGEAGTKRWKQLVTYIYLLMFISHDLF